MLKTDATVAPQKIAFPTDLNLLNQARERTEAMIDAFSKHLGLAKKPRTYRKNARKAYLSVVRKKNKPFKVVRKAIRQQLQYLRRNLRTIDNLWGNDDLPSPLDSLMTDSLRMEIERSLTPLAGREADVIRLYFGLANNPPHTLEEIGQKFDLTRERVRQIKEKAIRRIKHTSRSSVLQAYLG